MWVNKALLLSAILSWLCISTCTSQNTTTYYVTPNASTTPCPPHGPCYEFKTYYQNSSYYFQSNTQFIFLPGVHMFNLGGLLLVEDKYNISLMGSDNLTVHTVAEKVMEYGFDQYNEDDIITYLESSTKIVCSNQSGFAFTNVCNLVLANLSVVSCGQYYSLTSFTAGVHLYNVLNLSMYGVSIQNSTGYGLVGVNVLGYSQIMRSSFIANNQYVKDMLQKMTVPGLSCSNENYTYNSIVYFNNGSVECHSIMGGNLLLQYLKVNESTRLQLTHLLFTLGLDGTFAHEVSCVEYGTGLSIFMKYQERFVFHADIGNTVFYRNQAYIGASLSLIISQGYDILLNNIQIMRGAAMIGGAGIYADITLLLYSNLHTFIVNDSAFHCNYVQKSISQSGSSMEIRYTFSSNIKGDALVDCQNCTFSNDAGFSSFMVDSTSLYEQKPAGFLLNIFINGSTFKNIQPMTCYYSFFVQTIDAFYLHQSEVNGYDVIFLLTGVSIYNCNFTKSRVTALNSTVSLYGLVIFDNCSDFTYGGALYLSFTLVMVGQFSQISFTNNRALYGGSIFIDSYSYLKFLSPCHVSFINNTALITGGAILVQRAPQLYETSLPNCFFSILGYNNHSLDSSLGVQLYFESNHAGDAGSVLYGGDIDKCVMDCSTLPPPFSGQCNGGNVFDAIFINGGNNTDPIISSDPTSVCPCNKSCLSSKKLNFTVYPGEEIKIHFVTVGQRNSTAPSVVILYTTYPNVQIISALHTGNTCANYPIQYEIINQTIFISTPSALVQTVPTENTFKVSITVLPCPTCFVLLRNSCICNALLGNHSLECYIGNQTAQATGNQWVGNTSKGILAVFDECPFDYCSNKGIIDLKDFSDQCNYNRTDVLCGKCQPGLSTTFGTSQCRACSHYYLLLIIPFAIMGLALVAVLFVFNLTVSAGTLNGMIFYANIFRINDNIFFPANQRSLLVKLLSSSIAWFNLDFGIETCFYDGMDGYSKTWLQFVFPLYIFTLMGTIIVAGRYSSLISKLCRFNAVPVLATLILLSYSKILRTIITIFSHAALETENATDIVWLYDGNMQFLEPKHAVLFVFGLSVLIFFVVPYTILLLIAPCLQAKSHWRCFHWINKIKPFLDCYQAPFKDKYRFWSGVLLLGRLPLYLLFALENNPTFKLWGIMIVMYLYMAMIAMLSVYKNWFFLLLEMLFIMNMSGIVAATLLHQSAGVGATGYSIAGAIGFLLTVCGVIIYHAYHQCKRISWLWSRMKPSTDTTQPLANGVLNVSGKDLTSGTYITVDNGNEDDDVREPLLHEDS